MCGECAIISKALGCLPKYAQMGFDADMLEILFHELNEVTDKFFVMESTRTHNKGIRKALLWDRLKTQRRFEFIQDKVVHVVLDDTEAFVDAQVTFAMEDYQEKARWESFVRWNNHTNFFGPDDVLGFGDVDEIPSRHNVHLLRHCSFAGLSVDIGSWVAWSRLTEAFRSDWAVPGNPWTLGDPTYWTVASATQFAKNGTHHPNRMRGTSGHYLLGGIHMTDNGYLPFILAKLIACSECGNSGSELLRTFAAHFQRGNVSGETSQEISETLDRSLLYRHRFRKVTDIKGRLGAAYYLPWFLQCNVERYASWYGGVDSRLLE